MYANFEKWRQVVELHGLCASSARVRTPSPFTSLSAITRICKSVRYSRPLDERARIFEHRGIFRARDCLDAPAGFAHFFAHPS
jgi:hypothetical protein